MSTQNTQTQAGDEEVHLGNVAKLVAEEVKGIFPPIKKKFFETKEYIADYVAVTKMVLATAFIFNILGLSVTTFLCWLAYDSKTFTESSWIVFPKFLTALISFLCMLLYFVVFARLAGGGVVAVAAQHVGAWALKHTTHLTAHIAPGVLKTIRKFTSQDDDTADVSQTTETTEVVVIEPPIGWDKLDNFLRKVMGAFTSILIIDFLLQFPMYRSLTDLLWVVVAVGILVAMLYACKRETYWIPILQDASMYLLGGSIVMRVLFAFFLPGYWQKLYNLFEGWGPDTWFTRFYWAAVFSGALAIVAILAMPKKTDVNPESERQVRHLPGLKIGWIVGAIIIVAWALLFGARITNAESRMEATWGAGGSSKSDANEAASPVLNKPEVNSDGSITYPARYAGWYQLGTGTHNVKVNGRIDFGGITCGPDGVWRTGPGVALTLAPNLPFGAFIAKVGENGHPFLVGPAKQIQGGNQITYVAVNDSIYDDNRYSYTVVDK